jgi:photosystem II stability/assembly factor-like uncharacterized protein
MRTLTLLVLCALAATAHAQWDILPAPTTADLRGVSAPTPNLVWVSGTHGTVLRSTDAGTTWLPCATPPNAGPLDFRAIQAFDANTAIVMSSGKGDLSRLYKTTNACRSWTLLFTNPDKEGFWDALQFANMKFALLVGDPVPSPRSGHKPQIVVYVTEDGGAHFKRWGYPTLEADPAMVGSFAASNTSLVLTKQEDMHGWVWLGTGGKHGPMIFHGGYYADVVDLDGTTPLADLRWEPTTAPLAKGESAGTFSIALKGQESLDDRDWIFKAHLVAVGGDYLKPNDITGTAAFTTDGGQHWLPATTPPHGYRSAVAYSAPTHTWITVGPNGTDISTDDGRNWHPLLPLPGEAPDSAQHWNALALPFVVGPHGRVGILNPAALKPTPDKALRPGHKAL